jgi:hypothetical protein
MFGARCPASSANPPGATCATYGVAWQVLVGSRHFRFFIECRLSVYLRHPGAPAEWPQLVDKCQFFAAITNFEKTSATAVIRALNLKTNIRSFAMTSHGTRLQLLKLS